MRDMMIVAAVALLAAFLGACSRDAGTSQKMEDMEAKKAASTVTDAHAFGVVDAIDPDARKVTITHDPILDIGWGAMTMTFPVDGSVDPATLTAGDRIHFVLAGADGDYRVVAACRVEGDDEVHKRAIKAMTSRTKGGDTSMGIEMQRGAVMPCADTPQ